MEQVDAFVSENMVTDASGLSAPAPVATDVSPPPPSEVSPPPPVSTVAPESSPSPPPPSTTTESSPPPPSSEDSNSSPSPPESASPPPPNDSSPATDSPSNSGSSSTPASSSSTPSPPVAMSGTAKSPSASRSSLSAPPPPTSSSSSSSSSSNSGILIAGVLCGVLLIVMIVVLVTCCIRKKKRKQYFTEPPPSRQGEYYNNWNSPAPKDHIVKLQPQPSWGTPPQLGHFSNEFMGTSQLSPSPSPMSIGPNQSSFSYDQLAAATSGFSQENILGQGGFGYVHKGVLPNGREVAVKSLKSGSGQGEREFQAEVEMLSRVHHRHLVSLVGYCIADGQRMLVYEFVPNKTLEFHLHGKGQPVMDWATRMRIALGSAKGLAYLHEDCHPKIIHRDIKAANILLDTNFEAMVADFGLAKLSSDNNTHVSTRVMGTFGYLAPEYASSGKLTDKSDVFSFGVMLLELITGRKPVDHTSTYMEDSLVDWARPLMGQALENGNSDGLVDVLLENQYDPDEMARMVACASASIRHSARRRPRMIQIVRALEGDSSLDDLIDGSKPVHNSLSSSNGSSVDTGLYDTGAYNTDIMKFKKMVMTDEIEATSEFGTTRGNELNPSSSNSDLTDYPRHKI